MLKASGDPRLVPVMVTNVPTGPLEGLKELIVGACANTFKARICKANKKNRANNGDVMKCDIVKREPTKYNIFVKETILHLKTENPDKPYKDLMKMAADKWNENKIK